jgi:hypothetical protein
VKTALARAREARQFPVERVDDPVEREVRANIAHAQEMAGVHREQYLSWIETLEEQHARLNALTRARYVREETAREAARTDGGQTDGEPQPHLHGRSRVG